MGKAISKLCEKIESKRKSSNPLFKFAVYAKDSSWKFMRNTERIPEDFGIVYDTVSFKIMSFLDFENAMIKLTHPLLTRKEMSFLLTLPELIPADGVIVEIGSYRGGSTVLLSLGSIKAKKGKVYAIDLHIYPKYLKRIKKEIIPHDVNAVFLRNIKITRAERHIVPMLTSSEEVAKGWKEPVSLLWIDGDHKYESVKRDFLSWEKHVKVGGIIAFHDSCPTDSECPVTGKVDYYPGPGKVIDKFVKKSKRFEIIKTVDTITCARKLSV